MLFQFKAFVCTHMLHMPQQNSQEHRSHSNHQTQYLTTYSTQYNARAIKRNPILQLESRWKLYWIPQHSPWKQLGSTKYSISKFHNRFHNIYAKANSIRRSTSATAEPKHNIPQHIPRIILQTQPQATHVSNWKLVWKRCCVQCANTPAPRSLPKYEVYNIVCMLHTPHTLLVSAMERAICTSSFHENKCISFCGLANVGMNCSNQLFVAILLESPVHVPRCIQLF
jgi:hypothetical protein